MSMNRLQLRQDGSEQLVGFCFRVGLDDLLNGDFLDAKDIFGEAGDFIGVEEEGIVFVESEFGVEALGVVGGIEVIGVSVGVPINGGAGTIEGFLDHVDRHESLGGRSNIHPG